MRSGGSIVSNGCDSDRWTSGLGGLLPQGMGLATRGVLPVVPKWAPGSARLRDSTPRPPSRSRTRSAPDEPKGRSAELSCLGTRRSTPGTGLGGRGPGTRTSARTRMGRRANCAGRRRGSGRQTQSGALRSNQVNRDAVWLSRDLIEQPFVQFVVRAPVEEPGVGTPLMQLSQLDREVPLGGDLQVLDRRHWTKVEEACDARWCLPPAATFFIVMAIATGVPARLAHSGQCADLSCGSGFSPSRRAPAAQCTTRHRPLGDRPLSRARRSLRQRSRPPCPLPRQPRKRLPAPSRSW